MQLTRYFTQGADDAYDLIHLRQRQAMGDEFDSPLEHPDGWSREAVEILADESAACALPPARQVVEENTVPSWLWQLSPAKSVGGHESSVCHIFNRVVGAAVYQGWKQGLFQEESAARIFYDEARYLLAQRFLAIEPRQLATLGIGWAYGLQLPKEPIAESVPAAAAISNAMIDAVVSGKRDRAMHNKWQKIIGARAKASATTVHFTDTEAQWESPVAASSGARLNLMAFRHNDGSINIDALRQATRIAVCLLDLPEEAGAGALSIGTTNLAPLLMAMALPYDSEAGRATAAALNAIVTAEAYAASAELAAARGPAPQFYNHREELVRALRNHRRAAYGERDDYERMPVAPSPLAVTACPDLALNAAARAAWDHALYLAQAHGLRHTQVTSLAPSTLLTFFMESESEGIAPMRSLLGPGQDNADRRAAHPSVVEALVRLGCDDEKIMAAARYIAGTGSLKNSPVLNHAALATRGFTATEIEKLEAYLPQATSLRHVFTVWILGVDFCRKVLKVPAAKIDDMRFNLLKHIGFSDAEVQSANVWVYGHDNVAGMYGLTAREAAVLAVAPNLPPEASIRMAASVQSFLSGQTNLTLNLPVGLPAEQYEKLLLDAWRRGVKSMTVVFDPALELKAQKPAAVRRKAAFLHAKAPALPKRQSRSATARMGSMSHTKLKTRSLSKTH